MSCPLDKHELYRLLEPYAKYGDDDGFYVRSKGVTALSEFLGIPFKDAMIILLEQDIWPERFRRNRGVFTSRQMARLLSLRVFIAGCGGLGGHVASLLARMGAGGFRLCDPDIFEESNLNRQYFCTEKTLGRSKALVCREGLLDIASYLEIDARVLAVAPDNLSSLLEGMDAVIDCLDSIPRKKMLENAARAAGLPFLHGSVLRDEGFAFLDVPASSRLAAMYPDTPAGTDAPAGINTVATAVAGVACLMAGLLTKRFAMGTAENSPLFHLDCSAPELERFSPHGTFCD
ncbi:MAG: hypothetical protein DBY37_16650 [Desulfovibrionaceae bacterium]|nr:MAG: hypothetical protein DBY37_16650 [Desulfovibrionaceae bacterium]